MVGLEQIYREPPAAIVAQNESKLIIEREGITQEFFENEQPIYAQNGYKQCIYTAEFNEQELKYLVNWQKKYAGVEMSMSALWHSLVAIRIQ